MNTPDLQLCPMDLRWTGRRLEVSASLEGVWTPEHTLVAATANCLAATFFALSRSSRLSVFSWRVRAGATLEELPGNGYSFTRITLEPEIGVAAADIERAREVLGEAIKTHLFSESQWAIVQVEPHFFTAPVELEVAS